MSFTTSLKWLAHETLLLKSNFDLKDGKFIECCIAKFLEILHCNKTPNKFSSNQLKIAVKHPNFVPEPF